MNDRTLKIIWALSSSRSNFFGFGTVPACRAIGVRLSKAELEGDGSDPVYRGMETVFDKWITDFGEWFECVGTFALFLAAMDQADFDQCVLELQAFA